jgi:DNA-binding transcriptional ArsR family regulator
MFAALGDPMRLAVIRRLCDNGPLSTITLTRGSTLSRQGITKHLRTLQDAGLLRTGRVGRDRIWELRTECLADLRRYLDEISAQWDDALSRLRAVVEHETDG